MSSILKGIVDEGDVIQGPWKNPVATQKTKAAELASEFLSSEYAPNDLENEDIENVAEYIVEFLLKYHEELTDNMDIDDIDTLAKRISREAFVQADLLDEALEENLNKWFKEKWVRFGPDGKIRGACARGSDSEGKPKCLPQSKAHSLGKKGRKYAASKKRREDPNPERTGKAKNVATKKKTNEEQLDELNCWSGYTRVQGVPAGAPGSCKKKTNEEASEKCPHCGGELVSEEMMNEKQDACYRKVKSRYKVWPSAYASGALVQCRKKGASNWGTGGKKTESYIMKGIVGEEWTHGYGPGNTSHWSGSVNKGKYTHDGQVVAKFESFEHPSTFSQSHIKVEFLPTGKVKQFSNTRSGFHKAEKWVLDSLGVGQTESYIMKGIVDESASLRGVRVAPKTLDTLYQIRAYDREVSDLNKAKAAEKAKAQAARAKERGTQAAQQIMIASTIVPLRAIDNWIKNRETGTDFIINRYAGRQSSEFQSELANDPEFQDLVTDFFNIAASKKDNETVTSYYNRTYRRRPTQDEKADEFNAVDKLIKFVLGYMRKYGVDKTGRRVPPNFKYNLEEALRPEQKALKIKKIASDIIAYIGDDPSDSAILDAAEYEAKLNKLDPFELFDAVYDHFREQTLEASSPAQQAAIAINLKKKGQKPKNDVQEDYTGMYAAEKTPKINPYGGRPDRQFRGAISETPSANPTGASGEGGWRTYKSKSAGTLKEDGSNLEAFLSAYPEAEEAMRNAVRHFEYAYDATDHVAGQVLHKIPYSEWRKVRQDFIDYFVEHGLKPDVNEDTAYAGGMGQGGNAGQSYRKFTPKMAGVVKKESAIMKGLRKEGR